MTVSSSRLRNLASKRRMSREHTWPLRRLLIAWARNHDGTLRRTDGPERARIKEFVLITRRRLICSYELAEVSRMSKWDRLPPAYNAARPLRDAPLDFSGKRLVPSGPRRALPRLRTVGGACSVQGFGTGAGPSRGSSEVEHQAHNLGVTGSTPVHKTPRSAEDRLHRDAENVSTTEPEGDGRPRRSALARTEASPGMRRSGGCDANGRPEARGFRRPSPSARGRRRGAYPGVSASWGRLPKRTWPAGRVGRSGAPRPEV